jgi:beta-lactam-binding protein with PASTA domain
VGQTWANPLGTMQITLDPPDATGASVTIRSSFAPDPPKTVPNLLGRSTTNASNAVTAAGLTVGNIGTLVDFRCASLDNVLTQTPAPGTQLPAGSPVDFKYGIPPGNGCPTPQ